MKLSQISLIKSDITQLNVDAIVNAANSKLAGGGGVDGAIHKVAGPNLLLECLSLNGCETGNSKITMAYNLPCKYVIHTVGPVWRGGRSNEDELLKNCYLSSLEIAHDKEMNSIAFSNISTGIYGFPKERAALIAYESVKSFLKEKNSDLKVIFVCFDIENYNLYSNLLDK